VGPRRSRDAYPRRQPVIPPPDPMRRLFPLTALAALGTVSGCRGGADANANRHSIVDSRDTYDPRSLDPSLSTDVPTGRAVGYVFDGLTRFTPDARVVPALATRWEVTPDGRTYTFHLRPGVKFHDGSALTANSVVASFKRVLAPGSAAGRTWPLQPIEARRVCRRADLARLPLVRRENRSDSSSLIRSGE